MKSLAKNYFLNLSYQILTVILPLVTAPYLARVLGADRIGEYSFVQSIVAYFALFAIMGTNLYGQRMIAICHAQSESPKKLFKEIVALRVVGVSIALLVYFCVIFPGSANPILYAVAAIEVLAIIFDISWYYQGIEQFQNITLCNGLSKLLGAASIFLFVKTRDDLSVYVLFLCGSTLLGNVVQWVFLPKYMPKGDHSHARLSVSSLAQHLIPSFRLFLSQLATKAYTVLDKTMIGLITRSNFENGYYDQSQNLIHALVTLVISIGTVMASRITILWNSKDENRDKQVQDLLLFSFRLVFALSVPITAGLMIIAPRFVPIYYGDHFEPVVRLIQILAVIVPVIGCSNIIGIQLFVPSGRENLLTRSVFIGAAVNIVLNSMLIARWGAVGAAIASVLAELVVTGVQMFYARKEVPFLKVLRLLGRYLVMTLFISAIGLAVSHFAGTGIFGMALVIISCVVPYAALLFGLKDPVLNLFKM